MLNLRSLIIEIHDKIRLFRANIVESPAALESKLLYKGFIAFDNFEIVNALLTPRKFFIITGQVSFIDRFSA